MISQLPLHVTDALNKLSSAGFEGYIVGGCVRDYLLGREPEDWDIATNALPEQVKSCFASHRVIETGLKHGTVTVLFEGLPLEITTYRVDGTYSDYRRPDGVTFTTNLADDLSRRDFRMNAMAFHPQKGLVDPFGGREDLSARRICCVGNPAQRFREDALRILRAARFASVLEFNVEPNTAAAMEQLAHLLRHVSAERVCVELTKACTGSGFADVLSAHRQIFAQIIPEIIPMFGFAQHSRYHHLDVFEHTREAVRNADPDVIIRITMLLHDIGKPITFTLDQQCNGHFYGHESAGAEIANRILNRLRFDNETRNTIIELIRIHDIPLEPQGAFLRRKLNRHGPELLRMLLRVQRADTLAHAPRWRAERLKGLQMVEDELELILKERLVFSLRDLAVNGNDLMHIGYLPGKQLGFTLKFLLDRVIDGNMPNEKEALITEAQRWKEGNQA